MTVWVDGRAGGRLDARDRGLHYGDGAFETMRVRAREVRLLDYHLERLADACRRLQIRPPQAARLRREVRQIASAAPDAVLKLLLTRGVGVRGYRPTGRERATRVISLHPLSRRSAQAVPHPVRVRMCAMRLGTNEVLAGMKTLNRLESVLARAEWTDVRIWEGLLRDDEDNVVCGTQSNVFARRGNTLLTPALDRCGVAGVMRRWVLEQAGALQLQAREVRLHWADLAAADEAFMTNAVMGVVPVRMVQHGRARLRFAEHHAAAELNRRLELL